MSIFPKRIPGVALSDYTVEQARADADRHAAIADELHARVSTAEQDTADIAKDLVVVAAERDQAIVERDDLSVRTLPNVTDYLTEPFDEPIPSFQDDFEDLQEKGWPPVHGDKAEDYARMPSRIEVSP